MFDSAKNCSLKTVHREPHISMATLKFLSNEQEHDLSTEANSIGRSPDNNIVIDDESVSGHHAQIVLSANGYVVRDLNSTNGTQVDHIPVDSALLRNNDIVQFGNVVAEFRSRTPASTTRGTSSKARNFVFLTLIIVVIGGTVVAQYLLKRRTQDRKEASSLTDTTASRFTTEPGVQNTTKKATATSNGAKPRELYSVPGIDLSRIEDISTKQKIEDLLAKAQETLDQIAPFYTRAQTTKEWDISFYVRRKLEPEAFPGIPLNGGTLYEILIKDTLHLLIAHSTQYTSKGSGSLLVYKRNRIQVKMDDGFNSTVQIWEEIPAEIALAVTTYYQGLAQMSDLKSQAKSLFEGALKKQNATGEADNRISKALQLPTVILSRRLVENGFVSDVNTEECNSVKKAMDSKNWTGISSLLGRVSGPKQLNSTDDVTSICNHLTEHVWPVTLNINSNPAQSVNPDASNSKPNDTDARMELCVIWVPDEGLTKLLYRDASGGVAIRLPYPKTMGELAKVKRDILNSANHSGIFHRPEGVESPAGATYLYFVNQWKSGTSALSLIQTKHNEASIKLGRNGTTTDALRLLSEFRKFLLEQIANGN